MGLFYEFLTLSHKLNKLVRIQKDYETEQETKVIRQMDFILMKSKIIKH